MGKVSNQSKLIQNWHLPESADKDIIKVIIPVLYILKNKV